MWKSIVEILWKMWKNREVLIWQEGDPVSELTDEIQEDMDKLKSGNNY